MDATYAVGENVYLKIKILSSEEQPEEVRYEVQTTGGKAKFFINQTKESMKRSPEDVDNSEGEKIMRDVFADMVKSMKKEDDYSDAFGSNIKSLPQLLASKFKEEEIIKMYKVWVAKNNIMVNSIVSYTPGDSKDPENETYTCVVISIDFDKKQNLDVYKLYHHDEVNDKHEFFNAIKTELINLETTVDVDHYFDQLGDAIDEEVKAKQDESKSTDDKSKSESK